MGNIIVSVLTAFSIICAFLALCLWKGSRGYSIFYLALGITLAAGIFLIRDISKKDVERWEEVMQSEEDIKSVALEDSILPDAVQASVVWKSGQTKTLYADRIQYSGSEISVKSDKFNTLVEVPGKYKKK